MKFHGSRRALLWLPIAALPVRMLLAQTDCTTNPLLEAWPSVRGSFSIELRSRYFLIPSRVVSGLKLEPGLTARWSASDRLALTFAAQTVDNSGPGRQGRYLASRTLSAAGAGSGNFFQEQALGARWLVGNSCTGQALVFGASLSRGVRSYVLRDTAAGSVLEGDNQRELVPAFDASLEVRRPRWHLALGFALALFPTDNALYLRRIPDVPGDAFGTTSGLSLDGAGAFGAGALRARLFVPLSGANTIHRGSGRTVRSPVLEVGIGYAVNPVLATELFLSNGLGGEHSGALSLVADREYSAIGAGVRYTSGSRSSSRREAESRERGPAAGFSTSLLDPSFSRVLRASLGAGNGATHASLGGSPVPDLALVTFVDYVSGTLDESDLGALMAVRFVRQAPRAPFSVAVLFAASRSNNVLVNLLAGRADEFARRGLKKSGFRFGDESVADAKLYLLTGAVPVRRDFANGGHIWGAPTLSVVQRRGIELAGAVGGLTWPLAPTVYATLTTGVSLASDGNALEETSRVRRIPWGTSLAWTAPTMPFTIELYGGNRVGSSPFHALRVRANSDVAVGLGVTLWSP